MTDAERGGPGATAEARGAWVEVDLGAIRANLATARKLIAPPVALMAVVKADAYGHGMPEVARTALDSGCTWLGVGNLAEGLALRAAGIDAPCLVLAPPLPGDDAAYIAANLIPSLDSVAAVGAMAAAVRDAGGGSLPPLPVHLLIDTGIGRYGARPREAAAVAEAIAASPELELAGVYTHFAQPGVPSAGRVELALFRQAVAAVEQVAGPVALHHAAGSEAAILIPESRLGMVRLGNLLYGYWAGTQDQLPAGVKLRAALRVCCRVAAVRDVGKGQSIGYGGYRAGRAMRVAVLPVGFADGVGLRAVQVGAGPLVVATTLAREAAKAALARYRPVATIGGRGAPIVGRVGMQFTLVDVTALAAVRPGDLAELPGVRATAAAALPKVYLR